MQTDEVDATILQKSVNLLFLSFVHTLCCLQLGFSFQLSVTPAMSYVFNFYAGLPTEGMNVTPPPSGPRAIRARSEGNSPRRHHGTDLAADMTLNEGVYKILPVHPGRGLQRPLLSLLHRLQFHREIGESPQMRRFCTASATSISYTPSRRTSGACKIGTS